MKRNWEYSHAFEKAPLIPLSRRFPFFLLEYAKITKRDHSIAIFNAKSEVEAYTSVPAGSIGALILGPGCSITSEACRVLTARGCLLGVGGEFGLPIYMTSNHHRSPLMRIKQVDLIMNENDRLDAAKMLLLEREKFIKKFVSKTLPSFHVTLSSSIEKYLGQEAAWAKMAYSYCARFYSTEWKGRESSIEIPIKFLNHLCYSLADLIIIHRGFDQNLGILHGRTKGGGFTYDLADVIKPLLALDLAFKAKSHGWNISTIKKEFLNLVVAHDIIKLLSTVIDRVFRLKS